MDHPSDSDTWTRILATECFRHASRCRHGATLAICPSGLTPCFDSSASRTRFGYSGSFGASTMVRCATTSTWGGWGSGWFGGGVLRDHDHVVVLTARPVQKVYDHLEDGTITQVPLMMHLLRLAGFPSSGDLEEDMTLGFQVLGSQHPGPGWMPRLDGRCSEPLDVETFIKCNRTYVFSKLRQAHVDANWSAMLEEVLQEREQGKLSGPYASPDDWPVQTVSVNDLPLLPTPLGLVCPAWSFSVQQSDKIRRCEDYRRSWRNATVGARDSPYHHTIESYTALARKWLSAGCDAVGHARRVSADSRTWSSVQLCGFDHTLRSHPMEA